MADAPLASIPRHPLRVVVHRTGLSADLLRAWERRYGAVTPTRTAGGQRLYSDRDIERLRLLHRATVGGRAISQVAALPLAELEALVRDDEAAQLLPRPERDVAAAARAAAEDFVGTCLSAIDRMDAPALEGTLKRAALALSATQLIDTVVAPLLARIGDRWQAGALRPAHEHLASAVIHRILSWVIETFEIPVAAPPIVVGTPAGQLHELGAMLAAATAAAEGWRVVYLGPNLPAEEIAAVARETHAHLVALSVIHPARDPHAAAQLQQLALALGPDVPLAVGGAAAVTYEPQLARVANARLLADLDAFRAFLRARARMPPPSA